MFLYVEAQAFAVCAGLGLEFRQTKGRTRGIRGMAGTPTERDGSTPHEWSAVGKIQARA